MLRVLFSVSALAKGFDCVDGSAYATCARCAKASTRLSRCGARAEIVAWNRKKDCLLLDFSGNIVRMAEDYSDIFYNGLDALDAGEKLDKTISRDNEEKPEGKARPVCGYQPMASAAFPVGTRLSIHRLSSTSTARCGKSGSARRSTQTTSATCGNRHACMHAGIRRPIKQQGRAKHIFRDISGEWPDSSWNIANTQACRSITRGAQQDPVHATSHTRNLSGGGMRFEDFAAAHGLIIRHVEYGAWRRVPTTDHPMKRNGAYRHLGEVALCRTTPR